MIEITLLDGTKITFNAPTTGYEIAMQISPKLADSCFVVYVNDELWDLSREINFSCKIQLVNNKNPDVLLPLLRHDMAHLLAQATLELFPNTKLATGPATEHGFFYDFLPSKPFTEDDLSKIETKMLEIIDRNEEITRTILTKEQALEKIKSQNEPFKVEILEGINAETVSFYKQGAFEDLCLGPHSKNTKQIPKSFKLTKVSGVYWKSDSKNPMLQRIYGVGFLNKKDLDSYLSLQAELEKYDHRKLGKELDLFHLQEEAVGSVFWHEKGWRLYLTLEHYLRNKLNKHDYKEVRTPQMIDKSLWELSGHWEKFRENMFIVNSSEDTTLAIKPMNCPAHVQIFKQGMKSYKDLPLKMSEFGCCHRNEPSGALHGLMRVRSFTQDDAHIFCTEDQIIEETDKFCSLLKEIYSEIFGEIEITVKFSDRPEKRAGSDATWDKAEESLYSAAKNAGLDLVINKGEGAFYGPKLEFAIKDSLGRDWQLGTFQVDFILPERLDATYVGSDGEKHHPVMLHRAILGSMERFIGILIEHYRGKFPLWLSPQHLAIATVSNKVDDYALKINQQFQDANIITVLDIKYNKINYKIRDHSTNKMPIIGIIGEQESANGTITLKFLGIENQVTLSVEEAINLIKKNINAKNINIEL